MTGKSKLSPSNINMGSPDSVSSNLVLFRITSIYYSTKVDANTPDTFKSLEQGNLGAFLGGQPYYFFGPSYPTGRPYFDVSNTTELPHVAILFGHRRFFLVKLVCERRDAAD